MLSSCASLAVLFFFRALCAEVYLSPRLCCPKNKAPPTRHGQAAQDARSLLLLIFFFLLSSLGHKYNFQVARVEISPPCTPQAAISQVSFKLGYCEMSILSLGKNSNRNVCPGDADSSHGQLQVEQESPCQVFGTLSHLGL